MNGVFWVSIPHILELHRRRWAGAGRACPDGALIYSCIQGKQGAASHPCAKALKEKLPANRLNINCSLEMRILSKSCCLFRAGKNTEGFAWGVNMYKHLSSLHGSAGFVSTLPSEINQFTRGQVRGHAALKSAENVFPEGSLIFLWCFVSEVCVCVSCRDLAFWKSEPWGQDFDIALNIAGIVEYEYGLPFNAFPKDPQEAQSLIYYSMSSLGRTGWGFMGGQCSGALLNLEVEMS